MCRKSTDVKYTTDMRKILSFLSAAAALCILSGCSGEPKTVKVLYWNIQNGMWSDQGNNYDNFVEFVRQEDPDICIWAEAESIYRTGTADVMPAEDKYLPYNWDMLASRYGHRYVCLAGKRDEFPQVVTSRYPLKTVERINGNGRDTVVVHGAGYVVADIDGKQVNIVTVHTYPQKYAYMAEDKGKSAAENGGDIFRAAEMKYICGQTILEHDPEGRDLWMMAGDFNAISRADNPHLGRPEDDKAFLLHDYVRSSTPYIDIMEHFYPGEYRKSTFSGRRVDFIYVTEPLLGHITSARTITDGFATASRDPRKLSNFCNPSDHYPIEFTMEF